MAFVRANRLVAAALLLIPIPLAAGEVRGRVTKEGRPFAGASIAAVPFEPPLEQARRDARKEPAPAALAETRSGPDGTFRLVVEAKPGGPAREFQVEVGGGGIVPVLSTAVFSASDSEELNGLDLSTGGALSGLLEEAGGSPVAGAEVILHPSPGSQAGDAEFLPAEARTRSGPDGSFRLEGASRAGNTVIVHADGWAPFGIGNVPAGALRRPLVLSHGAEVRVRLRTAEGRAAKGIPVRLDGPSIDGRWIETGADGIASVRIDASRKRDRIVAEAGSDGYADRPVPAPLPEEGRTFDLRLAPPARLEGRIVDASGKGVPRVKVVATQRWTSSVVRSGPDGAWRLPSALPGVWRVAADDPRHALAAKSGIVLAAGETRRVDLVLAPASALSGVVVDEEGNAIAGAAGVIAEASESAAAAYARTIRRGAPPAFRSGPDGGFLAARQRPGENRKLTVSHPEFETATLGGLDLPPGGKKEGVRVVLRRGATVTGVARDPEGAPVAGAAVTALRDSAVRGGSAGSADSVRLRVDRPIAELTGPDGSFRVGGLSAGSWRLEAKKGVQAIGAVTGVRVVGGEPTPPVEIVLEPAASLSGRVSKRSGEGVGGLIVMAAESRLAGEDQPATVQQVLTQADGSFLVEGLRPGVPYELAAGDRTGPPILRRRVVAPAEGIELVQPATGTIRGKVVDAVTGRPVSEFQLDFGQDQGGGAPPTVTVGGGSPRLTSPAPITVEAEDGAFTVENVPVGKTSVRALAKGYTAARAGGIAVEEGAVRDGVEIRLPRGASLKGRVTDARSRSGIPDAVVEVLSASGGTRPRGQGAAAGDGGSLTDSQGRFEAVDVVPGKYRVFAQHPDFSGGGETVDVTEKGGSVEIQLSKGGTLGGVVLSASREQLAGAEVSLVPFGKGTSFSAGADGTTAAVTDGAGRFRFDHVAEGKSLLSASFRGTSGGPVEATLLPGESRDDVVVTLSQGATVRGTVTGLPDSQRDGVVVRASGDGNWSASTRVRAEGGFEISGAPAGQVWLNAVLQASSGGERSASARVTLVEGQADATAEIAFDRGSTLSGRLTRSGKGVGGARINVFPLGGSSGFWTAFTDEDGAFRVEGLLDRDYDVSAFSGSGAYFDSLSEKVTIAGDTTFDLSIPAGRFAGTVVEAGTRQPLVNAFVGISPPPGSPALLRAGVGYTTDSTGRFAFDGLEPGRWKLTTRKADFQIDRREVTVAEDSAGDLVVELQRGEKLGIQLRDGLSGAPLRSAYVTITDVAGSRDFMGDLPLDAEGRGEIPGLRSGACRVVVTSAGYAPQLRPSVTLPSPLLGISMTPGGRLEIRSGPETLGRKPARGRLLGSEGHPVPLDLYAADGWFTLSSAPRKFEHAPAGTFTLVVDGGASRTVTVPEGGSVVVELP